MAEVARPSSVTKPPNPRVSAEPDESSDSALEQELLSLDEPVARPSQALPSSADSTTRPNSPPPPTTRAVPQARERLNPTSPQNNRPRHQRESPIAPKPAPATLVSNEFYRDFYTWTVKGTAVGDFATSMQRTQLAMSVEEASLGSPARQTTILLEPVTWKESRLVATPDECQPVTAEDFSVSAEDCSLRVCVQPAAPKGWLQKLKTQGVELLGLAKNVIVPPQPRDLRRRLFDSLEYSLKGRLCSLLGFNVAFMLRPTDLTIEALKQIPYALRRLMSLDDRMTLSDWMLLFDLNSQRADEWLPLLQYHFSMHAHYKQRFSAAFVASSLGVNWARHIRGKPGGFQTYDQTLDMSVLPSPSDLLALGFNLQEETMLSNDSPSGALKLEHFLHWADLGSWTAADARELGLTAEVAARLGLKGWHCRTLDWSAEDISGLGLNPDEPAPPPSPPATPPSESAAEEEKEEEGGEEEKEESDKVTNPPVYQERLNAVDWIDSAEEAESESYETVDASFYRGPDPFLFLGEETRQSTHLFAVESDLDQPESDTAAGDLEDGEEAPSLLPLAAEESASALPPQTGTRYPYAPLPLRNRRYELPDPRESADVPAAPMGKPKSHKNRKHRRRDEPTWRTEDMLLSEGGDTAAAAAALSLEPDEIMHETDEDYLDIHYLTPATGTMDWSDIFHDRARQDTEAQQLQVRVALKRRHRRRKERVVAPSPSETDTMNASNNWIMRKLLAQAHQRSTQPNNSSDA